MPRDAAAILPVPRPELRDLPPAIHGGDAPAGILDFSTGVSPLPPPPAVLDAIRAADVTRYPHPTAQPLCAAVAAHHGVPAECVVAGAGSVELIWALARAFGGPGRRVAWLAPAFGEYAQAARASGAEAMPGDVTTDCDLLFAARPGNPLGEAPSLATARARLVVVDEAYLPLTNLPPVAPSPRVAVLRSLTKVFALPGLRVGYLVAAPPVAAAVRASLPPWNVSQPAIAGGIAALAQPVEPVRAAVARLRNRFVARLGTVGVELRAAFAGFVVVEVGDARAFAQAMLERGVRVRDCTSFGLPSLVRLGVRSDDDQERLLAAWVRI